MAPPFLLPNRDGTLLDLTLCLFLTRKLWDVGNAARYGHKGDLTTLTEAIHAHGGEARVSREAYLALPDFAHDAIIDLLKSLQMLPPDTPQLVVDEAGQSMDKEALQRELEADASEAVQAAAATRTASRSR